MEDGYRSPITRTTGLNLTRSPLGNGSSRTSRPVSSVSLTPARSIGATDRPSLSVDKRASGGYSLHYARLGGPNTFSDSSLNTIPASDSDKNLSPRGQSENSAVKRLNLTSVLNARRTGDSGYSPRRLYTEETRSSYSPYRSPRSVTASSGGLDNVTEHTVKEKHLADNSSKKDTQESGSDTAYFVPPRRSRLNHSSDYKDLTDGAESCRPDSVILQSSVENYDSSKFSPSSQSESLSEYSSPANVQDSSGSRSENIVTVSRSRSLKEETGNSSTSQTQHEEKNKQNYTQKSTYDNNVQYTSNFHLQSNTANTLSEPQRSKDIASIKGSCHAEAMAAQRSVTGSTKGTEDQRSSERSGLLEEDGDGSHPVPSPRRRSRRKLTKSISFKRLEDDEYIGFASLPEQVHRKAVKRGFEFSLMVVGETGLGKSTLINSLFLTDLYKDRKLPNIEDRVTRTVGMEKKELEIEERGVKLKLTIVDTPGFNDAVNSEESWKPIMDYINKQFELYFQAESGLNRKNIQDTRVHCCLYFISPYGHGLRPIDILVMKKLHHKVNIVPLIAKSDMLTKTEVKKLKERLLSEIVKHKIQIYQFPDCDSDEDEEFKQQDTELKKSVPFAVVGSNTVVEVGGKKVRGRMYPWGIVEVENPKHCDFIRLRQMLISTHMQDLKDVTADSHYENYRAEHIAQEMTHTQKERNKLKRDSSPNLDAVLDTEKLLQQKEAEIQRMQQMLAKMQAQLQNKDKTQMNGQVGHV